MPMALVVCAVRQSVLRWITWIRLSRCPTTCGPGAPLVGKRNWLSAKSYVTSATYRRPPIGAGLSWTTVRTPCTPSLDAAVIAASEPGVSLKLPTVNAGRSWGCRTNRRPYSVTGGNRTLNDQDHNLALCQFELRPQYARRVSNPLPHPCHGCALPTELRAYGARYRNRTCQVLVTKEGRTQYIRQNREGRRTKGS